LLQRTEPLGVARAESMRQPTGGELVRDKASGIARCAEYADPSDLRHDPSCWLIER
jgi:hypothetical protein